jgi:hypothetical protein
MPEDRTGILNIQGARFNQRSASLYWFIIATYDMYNIIGNKNHVITPIKNKN